MKGGLLNIPQLTDLKEAYDSLLHLEPKDPGIDQIALFSQWARFDARLAEIWIHYLEPHWGLLNPLDLNTTLLKQPWPAAAGLLLEFVQTLIEAKSKENRINKSVNSQDLEKFRLWKRLVTYQISPAEWEFFFIGLHKIGGKIMFEDACFSLKEYRDWGFLGRDILVQKTSSSHFKVQAHIEKEVRLQILQQLLRASPRITVKKYWEAIGQCISLRQAERDLSNSPILEAVGQTQARYYRMKSK